MRRSLSTHFLFNIPIITHSSISISRRANKSYKCKQKRLIYYSTDAFKRNKYGLILKINNNKKTFVQNLFIFLFSP